MISAARFVIVNVLNRPADDLGASPIFASETAADEAVESLADSGFDMDAYSVRELTTDDLVGDERVAMLAAVRDEAMETAQQERAECGSLAEWSDFLNMTPSWDALDAMLASRFGCVRARARLGDDVTAAYRGARESLAVDPTSTLADIGRELRDEAPAAPVGGWTPCGDLAYGTVEALREDDGVRISYTTGQDFYADDDTEIRASVEAALGVWIETPSGEWSAAEGDGEAVQTVALLDEQPTHEIVFTNARGEVTTTRVHLLDGVAYTRQEMETMDSADWEVSAAGEWRCQGQVTPGGASGTVEIRTLRPETVN